MTAFEEALVAVMEKRVMSALASMAAHSKVADPTEAMRQLGDAHLSISKLAEDIRCLKRLHEMAEDLEREAAE